ncbi:2-hydroxyacid dehydrogenase [Microbacterium memoriense]|uniref:2-hydroxyacid dehydrogenase n=1 Tax=Microbacterium memoriense TaxID=2978350 RepID=A0ABT2PCK5_9MICO|nr:2-hydroxyacid dehydrogenase [Microbacterium memoriense]MCT9002299.1 2-hydroxyacid dehydrogenase [Microbacterium memoriense]
MTLLVSVPRPELARDLEPLPEGVEVIVWPMDAAPPREHIDLVVPPYMALHRALPLLADLQTRLVQGQSIGYEGIAEMLPTGITFANAATVHETSTAELAVALTLAVQRHLDAFAVDGQSGTWAPVFAQSLADRRVVLLGYGGVGKAVAARLAPFEAEIVPVASRARDEDGIHVHGIDELADLLPTADIVILSLPGGESTRHIIGEAELTALPDGALIVNVGRGPLIDTDALVRHASARRIRAGLDVTDPEPLPQDHPLWNTPGVLISPHVGGASSAMHPRIAALVRRQIGHLLAGEEPENIVVRT